VQGVQGKWVDLMFDTIYYHANCIDGFTAAAILSTPECQMVPCTYGEAAPQPEEYQGKRVAVVDFCFDLETMRTLAREAGTLVVLDHHVSALPVLRAIEAEFPAVHVRYGDNEQSESGAILAYTHAHGRKPPEGHLVWAVARRDTWNHKEQRDYIDAVCLGLSHNIETSVAPAYQGYLIDRIKEGACRVFADTGGILLAAQKAQVERNVQASHADWTFDRKVIASANTAVHVSDTGEALLNAHPTAHVAMTWYEQPDGTTKVSLRSRGSENHDCSILAQSMAECMEGVGGGHKNAAGCTVQTHNFRAVFVTKQEAFIRARNDNVHFWRMQPDGELPDPMYVSLRRIILFGLTGDRRYTPELPALQLGGLLENESLEAQAYHALRYPEWAGTRLVQAAEALLA